MKKQRRPARETDEKIETGRKQDLSIHTHTFTIDERQTDTSDVTEWTETVDRDQTIPNCEIDSTTARTALPVTGPEICTHACREKIRSQSK